MVTITYVTKVDVEELIGGAEIGYVWGLETWKARDGRSLWWYVT